MPALTHEAHSPREVPPVYVAATAPKMQALAGEIADGCLTPSITTPAFVRYTRENVAADIDIGCTVVASIHESDREAGRDGAREIAGMYLANKFQNIKRLRRHAARARGDRDGELAPVAEAMERGGRLAAKAQVTDSLLDRCKPIAGTPADCIAAIEEYRRGGLHARDARALGRPPARPDPALRREGAPILQVVSEYDAAAFDAFEAAGWTTKKAAAYDALAGRVTARVAEPLLDAVGVRAGTRLLDVATGPATSRRAPPNAEWMPSASTSPRRCSRSRAPVCRRPSFVQADATALPFEDASFDAVVAAFLLLHVGTPERVVAEAARVLRPGGRAAFSVWDAPARGRWIGSSSTPSWGRAPILRPRFRRGRTSSGSPTTTSSRALLTGAGLTDVSVAPLGFGLELAQRRRALGRPRRGLRAGATDDPRPNRGDATRDPHALRRAPGAVPGA